MTGDPPRIEGEPSDGTIAPDEGAPPFTQADMKGWAPLILGWALAYFATKSIAGVPPQQVDMAEMLQQMYVDLFDG